MSDQSAGSDALVGRRVALVPLEDIHTDFLYRLALKPEVPWRWHGLPKSADAFRDTLWRGVLEQYVIVSRSDTRPIGLVTCYGANLHHGFAYLQLILDPKWHRAGWPLEASTVFISHLFRSYAFRKLYGESASTHMKRFASTASLGFEIEGCLKSHLLIEGEYQDVHLISISRESWLSREGRLTGFIRPQTNP